VVCAAFFCAGLSVPRAEETGDYITIASASSIKRNKFDQATEEFRKVLTAYPDNYNAYMQLAEIRKSPEPARLVILHLKKALAYNSGMGKGPNHMLADAFEQDRQYQNAIWSCRYTSNPAIQREQEGIQKR